MREKKDVTAEDVARKADAILRAVEALDKTIMTLANRIKPFSDEDLSALQARSVPPVYGQLPASRDAIYLRLCRADAHLDGMERDLNAIRAHLESADGEYQLTEDLQHWFRKDRKRDQ